MSAAHRVVGGVDGVRFRREREIDDGLRECQTALRLSEKMHGVPGGEAEIQRLGSGQADVLDGHAHDAARTVHWIFAGLQHAAQPVERGVRVGVAHALVQRRDDVVVLLALLVVEQHSALQRLCRKRLGESALLAALRQLCGDVERIESVARIAAGVGRNGGERIVIRA